MTRISPNIKGALYLCLAMGAFGGLDACIKVLSAHYPSMQVVTLRGLSSLPLALAWVAWRGQMGSLLRIRWPLHALRGALGIAMIWSLSMGLRELPMTQVYTLFFTAPLLMAVLSGPILGEPAQRAHWIALAGGLTGVLIAMRPGSAGLVSWASAAVLLTAACYATAALLSRLLSRTDSVESQVVWMLVLLAAGAGAMSASQWQPLRLEDALTLVILAVLGLIGQIAITQAFRLGRPSAIAPFEYTGLLWSVSLDVLIWAQWPDGTTLIGAAIIVVSGVWLLRQEHRHKPPREPGHQAT
jgi:drug/metabolite transporter (DMT)-like permease